MSPNFRFCRPQDHVHVAVLFLLTFLTTNGQECKTQDKVASIVTGSDHLGPFYLSDSPITNRIAPEAQLSNPNNVLIVEGTVFGNDCIPMENVLVEPWYAGIPDENGDLYSTRDSSMAYRGQISSNECGYYNYTQTFPNVYDSRPILHVHFRISSNNKVIGEDEEYLVTQMYFDGFIPTGYNPDTSQITSITTDGDGTRRVKFDIYLSDISGTADTTGCNITRLEVTNNDDDPDDSPSTESEDLSQSSDPDPALGGTGSGSNRLALGFTDGYQLKGPYVSMLVVALVVAGM